MSKVRQEPGSPVLGGGLNVSGSWDPDLAAEEEKESAPEETIVEEEVDAAAAPAEDTLADFSTPEVKDDSTPAPVVSSPLSYRSTETQTKLTFQDHYSLGLTPSSSVGFRGRRIQVYDSHDEQFLIEQVDSSTIKLRRVASGSFGQIILRIFYTIIAIFMAGFLFVFCFQVILFILMNLPVESGASELSDLDGSVLAGTFFAIPLLLYGMAGAMTLATAFVIDTWHGGPLVRSLTNWSPVVREWVAFTVFLGVPALALVVSLLSKRDNWWEMTARVWIVCVTVAFTAFCLGVVLREVVMCWLVVAEHDEYLSNQDQEPEFKTGDSDNAEVGQSQRTLPSTPKGWIEVLHQSFLISQAHRYAGVRENRYTVSGKKVAVDVGASYDGHYSYSDNTIHDKTKRSLYSRFVSLPFLNLFFERLDPPQRLFTVQEIRDVEPILTRQNWSLEKMCCRDSRRSTIMAARGPASLRYRQAWSSFACSIIGSLLVLLLLIGYFVWADFDAVLVALVTVMVFLCCLLPMLKDSLSLYRTYQGIYGGVDDDATSDVDANIFQVWETHCILRPRPALCYTTFVVEITILFLWPLGNLYKNNSNSIATLFLIVGLLSFFRIYFSVGAVLARTGMVSIRRRLRDKAPMTSNEQLAAQARISEILGNITENRSVLKWMYVFGTVSFLLYIGYLSALDGTSDVSPSNRPEVKLSSGFYYPVPTDETLAYPNCELTNVFREADDVGNTLVQLIDFSFLAALAYEEPENAQQLLDAWFGRGLIVDESDFVADYRESAGTDRIPVWFKLFRLNSTTATTTATTTDGPTTGIVAVRGSESKIDWLVNMQLWLSSAMAEVVHAIVPFRFMFAPIIDDMVTVVNLIQSESLKKVSYYATVARFCREMIELEIYDKLRLTGASLGGGTAMIAGAQANVPAVAISGPNAVLARRAFDPPLSMDQLNTRVFNVIPDRDMIAHIGGRARLFQEIDCTATSNDPFSCHSMWRTVCELAYTCGAENRPALCMCVERFGYISPQARDSQAESFEEVCGIEG